MSGVQLTVTPSVTDTNEGKQKKLLDEWFDRWKSEQNHALANTGRKMERDTQF